MASASYGTYQISPDDRDFISWQFLLPTPHKNLNLCLLQPCKFYPEEKQTSLLKNFFAYVNEISEIAWDLAPGSDNLRKTKYLLLESCGMLFSSSAAPAVQYVELGKYCTLIFNLS